MAIEKVHLAIEGMTCNHCENFVGNLIKELNGIKESSVSLSDAAADVTFDSDVITAQQIADAVNNSGIYKAKL